MGQSMVTEYTEYCLFCGKEREADHHLIFGSNKKLADEDKLIVPVCNDCHTMNKNIENIHGNPMACKLSKMLGQAVWEKHNGTREDFIKRYGRSYL